MNWYQILAFAAIIGVATQYAYGEDMAFEKVDGTNYFHLTVSETASVYLRIGDNSLQFEQDIKLNRDGKFSIKYLDDNIRVFVLPNDYNLYKASIFFDENGQRNRVDFELNQLDTSPYEKSKKENLSPIEELTASEILTGPDSVEMIERIQQELQKQQELLAAQNVTIIPRSEYTLSENKKLELVVRNDFHVPIKTTFNFDLQAIDLLINKYHDFYGLGKIGDVMITGNVTDAEGKLWMSINSTTNSNGYFEGQGLYIPDNTSTRGEWSLFLNAIKYFDDDKTFSTFDIVKPFFITFTNNNNAFVPEIHTIEIALGASDIDSDCDQNCFDPNSVEISVGDHVKWINLDSTTHILFSQDSDTNVLIFNKTLSPGEDYTHTSFNISGSIYDVFSKGLDWIDGSIIVK